MRKRPNKNIDPEFQGFLALFGWVIVNGSICPAVAGVAFVGVENTQTSVVKETKALRELAVVFVYFRNAIGEFVKR